MRPMRRKPADPMFMGEPSPSLGKIHKMNIAKLTDHIQALSREHERIGEKIKNLQHQEPRDDKRIADLTAQCKRLAALVEAGQQRLAQKEERKKQFIANGGRRPRR